MRFCSNCGNPIEEGAKFCSSCGKPVNHINDSYDTRQAFAGKVIKCPNCGENLKAFETVCPSCGYELRGAKATDSIRELETKLENAESVAEKASIIRHFPIPNTKEDIWEFLILATSNTDSNIDSRISSAWVSKLEQVIESDYLRDQFIRRQTIATQGEVDSIVKSYSKYNGYVSGRTQNKIIGTGVATIATVATGGLALTFAPGIAAAIAGEAVIGLHGAALTSASLAFVGGGSIAAGGLGMAGGTAIITGGGALIGLVSSGTASAAAVLLQTPSEYWVRQSSKLLTYCSCVLRDYLKDKSAISAILKQVVLTLTKAEDELNEIKAEKNDLDKDLIKKTEEYLSYLKKCRSELQKLTK